MGKILPFQMANTFHMIEKNLLGSREPVFFIAKPLQLVKFVMVTTTKDHQS